MGNTGRVHNHPLLVCVVQNLLLHFQHQVWAVSFVLVQLFQTVLRDRRGPLLGAKTPFGNVCRCEVTLGVDEVLLCKARRQTAQVHSDVGDKAMNLDVEKLI